MAWHPQCGQAPRDRNRRSTLSSVEGKSMHTHDPLLPIDDREESAISTSRRHLLVGAGTAAFLAAATTMTARAQDASPVPSPAASPAAVPSEVPSDEATAAQLALAKQEGDLYGQALAMLAQEATVVTQNAGDFAVSLIAEQAEGLWKLKDSGLEWTDPGSSNAHLEVAVRDAGDGRFVPGLNVSLSLTAPDGTDVGKHRMPFVWHPWIYHYGLNWKVPGDGDYTATVHIDTPTFSRHDQTNGNRYAAPVDIDYTITIKTGQK
jgi:hypothetical protein